MIILAYALSCLAFLMSAFLLIDIKYPHGSKILIPKLLAGALSPIWAVIGIVGIGLGWLYQVFWTIPIGIVSAGMMIWYVRRCTQEDNGFEKAFGLGWSDQILPEQAKNMTKKRWTWFLNMNAIPEPTWERDITYWTVPETDRQLLCDIWRPANGNTSDLAMIYMHGGAWAIGSKDFGTRPFFRHLVAQGHTVMDVAYRLIPEVDIYGMIGDVKRAITWMKANASRYGVNPEKIVLGGASAGGHLALLAGFAPQHPELTPDDLKNTDLSVSGVISYYGPTDMLAQYKKWQQERTLDLPPVPIGPDSNLEMDDAVRGRMDVLLGGHPHNALETYQLASPPNHVHPGCPPTLLIQGEQDIGILVEATDALYEKLVQAGVATVNIVFPWTNHVFDLIVPQVNPAAQSALYDVDRFLVLLLNK